MTILFWILACVGAVGAVCAAVVCVAMVVDAYLEWRNEPHQRSFYEGTQKVRLQLANDSHWFSECPATQELLSALACGRDVSAAREQWRKARATTQPAA